MYGFDDLFEKFIRSKGHICEDEFKEAYDEWLETFDDSLGASPSEIISKMSDEALINELIDECLEGSPSFAVMENIERRAPAERLERLLSHQNGNVVYCAAELLSAIGAPPLERFAKMLDTDDEELFELLVSELRASPDTVRDILLEQAKNGDVRKKTAIADILSSGSKDERVFLLLSELFGIGDNIPLYAGYLARYGDDRAAAQLYRALDTASYADYIEIRNAIESLGGVVDDYRDFSSDPEYIALKENNNGK